ncbi:hypothetical protein D3C59_36350 [Streptomyces sp. SHP22-7]|nr:hypothetical protein D3C59_36350 [Streptomyces sp. SHP22-7]
MRSPRRRRRTVRLADLYDWSENATGDADEAQQAYRDLVFEKQRLQHAVRLGDTTEVCKNPCPAAVLGPHVDTAAQRARCTNRRCTTPEGLSTSWTLTRLAAQTIERTESGGATQPETHQTVYTAPHN